MRTSRKKKKGNESVAVVDVLAATSTRNVQPPLFGLPICTPASYLPVSVHSCFPQYVDGNRFFDSAFGPMYTLSATFDGSAFSSQYRDSGDCSCICFHCGAFFWHSERIKTYFKDRQLHYHCCCGNGRVALPHYEEPPLLLRQFLEMPGFMDNIRAYNQMFSMTSFGARVDDSVNDGINRGDQRESDIGTRTILPASFTGGPRYMYSHYLDALAISRVFGNPQFFVTFTCNVNWPEISRHLHPYPRLSASDRADIVARVFNFKIKDFTAFLKDEKPLGNCRGVLYTVEFQKRVLPHCHTLMWVYPSNSRPVTDCLDDYISAELPDPRVDPIGYSVISATMMHGPCGLAKRYAPCMDGLVCSKKFPKIYSQKQKESDLRKKHK